MKTWVIGVQGWAKQSVARGKYAGALTCGAEARFMVAWLVVATLFVLCGLTATQ